MSRSRCLALLALFSCATLACADDGAIWHEYGLVQTTSGKQGKLSYTAYRMKDLTGALAAWEWQRTPAGQACSLTPFCTVEPDRITLTTDNYVLVLNTVKPRKADLNAVLAGLPDKRDSALPALLTFLPIEGIVPDSARYLLGDASYKAFAPELSSAKAGFDEGGEAQLAEYKIPNNAGSAKLALFYYPTPDMARQHAIDFKQLPSVFVKRSAVLLAIVYGPQATQQMADTLLSRVQYEAKITWNDVPPPPPIKPLYLLLVNILYMCTLLGALCLTAGIFYGAMRVYRRRYGQLESEEAMTTLRLNDIP